MIEAKEASLTRNGRWQRGYLVDRYPPDALEEAEYDGDFDMAIAEQIARYVCNTGFDDFDKIVIERTKDLCISAVGSTVLGAGMDVPAVLADYVRAQQGIGQAGVIGFGFTAPVEFAAMMNCVSSHCTELEDVAWPEAQYTCCVIPAMFTLAQALGRNGRELLEAIIIAFEVAARPGMICSNGGAAARGFLSCANNGTVGVAAGASRLLGLTVDQTRDAVTMATSVGGGLVRQTGSAAHVVEAGFAARDGIMAATLAARGLGGNPSIMDGKAGFFDALAGQSDIAFDLGTGEDLRVMAVGQKKYPCCYLVQRIIDGVKLLMAQHQLTADDVALVAVEVNQAFPTIVKYPEPKDVEEARFSLPHVVAGALVGEPMDSRSFAEDKLHDPQIAAQRAKVQMIVHDEWGYDQLGKQDIITLTTHDGQSYHIVCTLAHGDAEDPLSRGETIDKFRVCAADILPTDVQNETLALLEALDSVVSLTPLMDLLTPDRFRACEGV